MPLEKNQTQKYIV